MDIKEIGSMGGNVFTYVLAALQTNEVLQIIEFILSAIVTVLLIVYRVWHWYKEAKKDGKIEPEEIKGLADDLDDEIKKLKKGSDQNEHQ